jgi:hypothetical protein
MSIVQYWEASQRIRDDIPRVSQVTRNGAKAGPSAPLSKRQLEEICWRRSSETVYECGLYDSLGRFK